jgi:hypothetical protein
MLRASPSPRRRRVRDSRTRAVTCDPEGGSGRRPPSSRSLRAGGRRGSAAARSRRSRRRPGRRPRPARRAGRRPASTPRAEPSRHRPRRALLCRPPGSSRPDPDGTGVGTSAVTAGEAPARPSARRGRRVVQVEAGRDAAVPWRPRRGSPAHGRARRRRTAGPPRAPDRRMRWYWVSRVIGCPRWSRAGPGTPAPRCSGPDHLAVARRGHVQVEPGATRARAQGQTALVVDEGDGERPAMAARSRGRGRCRSRDLRGRRWGRTVGWRPRQSVQVRARLRVMTEPRGAGGLRVVRTAEHGVLLSSSGHRTELRRGCARLHPVERPPVAAPRGARAPGGWLQTSDAGAGLEVTAGRAPPRRRAAPPAVLAPALRHRARRAQRRAPPACTGPRTSPAWS